jgi:serine/threonine-protein kinase
MSLMQADTVVAERFRLVKMIGKGGMGSVWEAFDTRLATPCAVKFIEGELANVAEAQARFEREAKAAAQLRSAHVVTILDHGVWQSIPYIAMELLRGRDLGKWLLLRPDGKLTLKEVAYVVNQVCKALTKAHAAGLVHRDLKPDNIFLCNEESSPALDYSVTDSVVKILDFGVAKQTGQAIDGSNTKTGAMLGTPYYMSPEQAQGIKAVDGRSDLWSMGVIVYQCLTGRLPFESEALGDLLFKIFTHEAALPTQLNADLPPGIDGWWKQAASKQPEGRFQTAKDFSEAFRRELGDITEMEMTGRGRAQKLGGGTALMQNIPNTPNPYISPAMTAHMNTPNPAGNAQIGMWTPQNQGQSPVHPPMMMTPPGSQPGMQGPPGTFSGVDAPPAVPKKGAALPIIAGLAALAVLGAAFGGYAVLHKKGGGDGTAANGSASAAPSATVASADTTVTIPSAAPDPASTTTASTTAADSASAPTPPTVHPTTPGGNGRRPTGPVVVAGPATKPTTTAATTTTKPAGTATSNVTPHGLGF